MTRQLVEIGPAIVGLAADGDAEAFAEDLQEGSDHDAVERTENAIHYHQLKLVCVRAF
jgi:hypothetical protein